MILVKTMLGLGDAFASRPTIAALARLNSCVIVETPWPEVFHDIPNLCFKRPDAKLGVRCAERNARESKGYEVTTIPEGRAWGAEGEDLRIEFSYTLSPDCDPIPVQIARSAGILESVEWGDFFIGERERSPLAVFRIPTIRTEYKNESRNCAAGLVGAAVDEIGGDWIHLNDIRIEGCFYERPSAWEHAAKPKTHYGFADMGEFSIPTCLDLVSRARCVVTPMSWMSWAALAFGVPTLHIHGGYCSPSTIFGPLLDIAPHFKIVAPELPCACFDPSHDCAKSIPVELVKEAACALR